LVPDLGEMFEVAGDLTFVRLGDQEPARTSARVWQREHSKSTVRPQWTA